MYKTCFHFESLFHGKKYSSVHSKDMTLFSTKICMFSVEIVNSSVRGNSVITIKSKIGSDVKSSTAIGVYEGKINIPQMQDILDCHMIIVYPAIKRYTQ